MDEIKQIAEDNSIIFDGKEYPIIAKGVDLPVKYTVKISKFYKEIQEYTKDCKTQEEIEKKLHRFMFENFENVVENIDFLLAHFIGKEKSLELAPHGVGELKTSSFCQLANELLERVIK